MTIPPIFILSSALALAAAFSAAGGEVTSAAATEAAQEWIDGGWSMGRLGGRRAVRAETLEGGGAKMHVVSLDGGGFVVVGADDAVEPVVAFSPTCDARTDDAGPLWDILRADLAQRARAGERPRAAARRRWGRLRDGRGRRAGRKDGGTVSSSQADGAASATSGPLGVVSDVRVEPLVLSRWGQTYSSKNGEQYGGTCYNYYTPNNYPCGCVATALAQLMRFHRYPASATAQTRTCAVDGTSGSKTMKGGTYAYDAMPLVPETDPSVPWYAGGLDDAGRKAIGKLTYDCGVAMRMSWTAAGGTSGGAAAVGVLANKSYFKYKNGHVNACLAQLADASFRNRVVCPNLDAGFPVLLGLADHEVVADGYGYSDGTLYTHLNMGWADEWDVWYALPDVETAGYGSTVVESVGYNIFPAVTGEIVSGRVLDQDGNPVVGAPVAIRQGTSAAVLSNATTSASGVFAFVVPSGKSYVVTATRGESAASASVQTGTSENSSVTIKTGSCQVDQTSQKACGNAWGCDIVLSDVPTVAAPVLEPSGCAFYPSTNVVLSCTTAGATVRYTTDGSIPTEASEAYAGPIELSDDAVLRVRAFLDGWNPSAVVTASYAFDAARGAPDGDFYAKPVRIAGASGSRVVADNASFGVERGEPDHTLDGGTRYLEYRTCWFRWKSPGDGTVSVTADAFGPGYALPVALAVYPDGESMPRTVAARLALAVADWQGGVYSATATFAASAGTVYRIVCVQLYDMAGSYGLSWSGDLVCPPPAPTVIRLW